MRCASLVKTRGFSLIELILVLVIAGILAIVVVPKFSSTSSLSTHALRDQVIAQLRFVQWQQINDAKLGRNQRLVRQYRFTVKNDEHQAGRPEVFGQNASEVRLDLSSVISFEKNQKIILLAKPNKPNFHIRFDQFGQLVDSDANRDIPFLQVLDGKIPPLQICITRGGLIDDCKSGNQCMNSSRRLVPCAPFTGLTQ